MAVLNPPEVTTRPNPFPGLRPFGFDDSLLFFGRDGQSEELIRKLAVTHFLAVVGTSGSGKSSLVRAGLWPALLGGFMVNAGSDWRIATMRPSNDPIGNLAASLNTLDAFGSPDETECEFQTAVTEATLRRGNLGLIEAVRQGRMEPHENLLLVVDQFEELFRFERVARTEEYHNDAAAFVKLLLESARQRNVPIYVVMTMRSDFLGDCSIFWDLPEAINEGQYLIPRMTRDELRETITGPVAVFEAKITQPLVNRLLNDLEHTPDHLPILQHALMRTWDHWKKDHQHDEAIDLRHYEAVGTMTEALSQHADEAYAELADERSRQVAERIFKGLTEKGPDNREVRHPSELKELCALAEASESEAVAVVETFRKESRSFLMPPVGVPLQADSLIDVSHESLIRNWRRLKQWVGEEARSARIYRRLADTAVLHEAGEEGLLKDPALQVALDWKQLNKPNQTWARRYHPKFEMAMTFLDQSVAARDAEISAKEKRRKRGVRLAGSIAAVFFVLTITTFVFLLRAWSAETKIGQLLYLADINYANQAYEANKVLLARDLIEKLGKTVSSPGFELSYLYKLTHREKKTLPCLSGNCFGALSPDGRMLAIAVGDKVELWDVVSLTKLKPIEGESKDVGTLVFSPDSKILALVTQWNSSNRSLKFFNIFSGGWDTLQVGDLSSVAFSPDGKLLATGSSKDVTLWDFPSLNKTETFTQGEPVLDVAFSPDGRRLASAGRLGSVNLWDVTAHKHITALHGLTGTVYSIDFSPDGKTLAAVGDDEGIKLWDIVSGKKIPEDLRVDTADPASVVAFSPDGKLLVIGYEQGDLKILDSETKSELATLKGHERSLTNLAFSPDSKLLVSASEDKRIQLWDVITRIREASPLAGVTGPIKAATFSLDSGTLTAVDDEGVKVWDVMSHQRLSTPITPPDPSYAAAFSSDRKTLGLLGKSTIRIWENISQNEPKALPGSFSGDSSIALSHDGKLLVTASKTTVTIWAVSSQTELKTVQTRARVLSIIFSPDSKTIAAVLEDGVIKVWATDLLNEKEVRSDSRETVSVASLAFSSDGRTLASVFSSGELKVLDTTTLEVVKLSPSVTNPSVTPTKAVAFSPDGRRLASSNADFTITLWDMTSLRKLVSLNVNFKADILAFSPDGRTLAAGGFGSLRLLHAASIDEMKS